NTQFCPNTLTELFALRLAQRLGEPRAVRHFLTIVDRHSQGQLLSAYRRTIRNGHVDRGRGLHKELQQVHSNGHDDRTIKLIAIRIERRTVAAAVFHGEQLEYTDSRQLSSDNERALVSGVGFIQWMLSRFPVESAALEAIPDGEFQRRVLHEGISEALRSHALPIWEIPKAALFE